MSIVGEFTDFEFGRPNIVSSAEFRYENLDYIPFVSTISGIARMIFGAFETLFGLFELPFHLSGRCQNDPALIAKGILNLIRGAIAARPFIGNIILYVYDHTSTIRPDIRKAAGLD